MDDEHHIAIYDISLPSSPVLVAFKKGCRDVVLDMKFGKKSDRLILATRREIYIALFKNNSIRLSKASGMKNKSTALCIGFSEKYDAVIGLKSGKLGLLNGKMINEKVAHKKIVYAIC